MAVIQKHVKNYSPDVVCHKENHPSEKIGLAGCQKKWPEHNVSWSRPVARIWTVVLLLGTCLLYCARVAMPICAVSMAEQFGWSKRESGMVLGSFFWGYCFTQVLGGYVSDRVGGEKVLLLSAAAWGSMTAFTPVLAHFCSQPIFSMTLARFLMGLLQGVHYPSLASLCSQKVVESERGFLMSTVGSGSYLGTLVIGGAGSLMLDLYGWESVFYVSGLLSVLWAYCMWKYLLKGEGPIITLEALGSGGPQSKLTKRHWLRLFKQPAVCAVIITHLCTASTFFTLLSWLPTFFKDTFPDAKGWVFNVIPWLVAIPSSLFSGCLSDHLISQGRETTSVRKLMQVKYLTLFCVFVICLTADLLHTHGVSVNVQDLAPSCAGALFGVMNTCGAFSGVLMVYFSGYLIEATSSWASVFGLITTVNLLGLCTFLAFGEARRVDIDFSKVRHHNIHI
uniref:Solute carrier family 17 member 9 n=1 Tax=Mastacembelus armatus TaxID=205130 RepID=A0A7N8XMX7_9TELE